MEVPNDPYANWMSNTLSFVHPVEGKSTLAESLEAGVFVCFDLSDDLSWENRRMACTLFVHWYSLSFGWIVSIYWKKLQEKKFPHLIQSYSREGSR